MDNKSGLKKQLVLTLLAVMVLLAVLSTATYAWFTFTPSATVEEMTGNISDTGVDLLISNSKDGPFDVSCDLIVNENKNGLVPVTTADMATFSVVSKQNSDGIALTYKKLDKYDSYLLYGSVYLLSGESDCDLYLWMDSMDFGSNAQALAAMRLGLIIDDTDSYIFKLDDMGDTSTAEKKTTVKIAGDVYNGTELVQDPARNISDYSAQGDTDKPTAGANKLCRLTAGKVTEVKFYLWLEGCDDNCYNPVQAKDIALSLGFAGM